MGDSGELLVDRTIAVAELGYGTRTVTRSSATTQAVVNFITVAVPPLAQVANAVGEQQSASFGLHDGAYRQALLNLQGMARGKG